MQTLFSVYATIWDAIVANPILSAIISGCAVVLIGFICRLIYKQLTKNSIHDTPSMNASINNSYGHTVIADQYHQQNTMLHISSVEQLQANIKIDNDEKLEEVKTGLDKLIEQLEKYSRAVLVIACCAAIVFAAIGIWQFVKNDTDIGRGTQPVTHELLTHYTSPTLDNSPTLQVVAPSDLERVGGNVIVHSVFQNTLQRSVIMDDGRLTFLEKLPIEEPVISYGQCTYEEERYTYVYNNGWGTAKEVVFQSENAFILEGEEEVSFPFSSVVIIKRDIKPGETFELRGGEIRRLEVLGLNRSGLQGIAEELGKDFFRLTSAYTLLSGVDEMQIDIQIEYRNNQFSFYTGGLGAAGNIPSIVIDIPFEVKDSNMEIEFKVNGLVADYIDIQTVLIPDRSCKISFFLEYELDNQVFATNEFTTEIIVPIYTSGANTHSGLAKYCAENGIVDFQYGDDSSVQEALVHDNLKTGVTSSES